MLGCGETTLRGPALYRSPDRHQNLAPWAVKSDGTGPGRPADSASFAATPIPPPTPPHPGLWPSPSFGVWLRLLCFHCDFGPGRGKWPRRIPCSRINLAASEVGGSLRVGRWGATSRGGERGGGAALRVQVRGLSEILKPEQSLHRFISTVCSFGSTGCAEGLSPGQ